MTERISGNYIGGRWWSSKTVLPVRSPVDRSVLAEVEMGGKAEAFAAADAASEAFGAWSLTTARERADVLLEASRLMVGRSEEIGRLLSLDSGKRLPEAVAEVRFAADYFSWFAEQARRPIGAVLSPGACGRRQATLHRPAGVAVCLTPWNFPVSLAARKLAPALAAGCTTVVRASERAPLGAIEMVSCLVDAGVPPGVVNLVQGPASEQTDALLSHPAVRIVSFTGSTEVGRRIMQLAAERIVRPLLELGGDAAFIVFEDADLDAAVAGAMVAKFRNNGQSCIAANRFFVQASVYAEFRDRFVAAVEEMSVGDPTTDPVADLGPLIDDDRVAQVQAMVDEAMRTGARRLTSRVEVPSEGCYLAPTLLEDVPETVALSCREIFGPVQAVA